MDNRLHLSKLQCPAPGSEEAEWMADKPYREIIGALLWIANGTRPDIAYAVGQLAKYTAQPGRAHWDAVLRILAYLAYTVNHCIRYCRSQDSEVVVAKGYCQGMLPLLPDPLVQCAAYVDASHAADLDTRRSVTRYLFFLSGGPVSWQSRVQSSVALSSMEAEYMALCAAAQEAMWANLLFAQMKIRITSPMVLFEDNKAAILFTDHPGDHRRTMHIDTRKYFARDARLAGEFKLSYVPTAQQLADGLTKALPATVHYDSCLSLLLCVHEV